jgi:TIR domain
VSYARTDAEAADRLVAHLEAKGCTPWLDRGQILVGDDFVKGLGRELARCDGLVLLLTARSAVSSWCQAETQRALALGMPVFVVQREPEAQLPDALERLLRDVQRIEWSGETPPALAVQVRAARARRLRRQLSRVTTALLAIAALTAAAAGMVWRSNALERERARSQFVEEVRRAAAFWPGGEVRSKLGRLRDDALLPISLQAVVVDPTASATARLNAWQAIDALREGRAHEWRFHVPKIEWTGGRLSNTLWVNATYGIGTIKNLVASRIQMAGLVFGPGPSANKPGLSLSDVRIADADIWFLRMDGTQLIDVELTNCKLRGAQLDLSGAAGVRFLSREEKPGFISNDVGIIEDSWIVQRHPLPGKGVLDLTEPEQEILFEGIQFSRVRFEGEMKPGWFRKSDFRECVFDTNVAEKELKAVGNLVENCLQVPRAATKTAR